MIGKDQISEAMRNTDAIAEEHSNMPRYWAERDVNVEDLMYCATQHGLRQIMMMQGVSPNQSRPVPVATSPEESALMLKFAGAWVSGFAAAFEILRRQNDSP